MTPETLNGQPLGGLSNDFDPQWLLTPEQQQLQAKLIELCAKVLRPNAIASDRDLVYPRENLEALASLGLLGLLVPKEWGGAGRKSRLRCDGGGNHCSLWLPQYSHVLHHAPG
ncbi:MAG: acyl-CoA dehydrogenase family protein, partial [Cyanobacteria bacterium P01_F01_bin.4]